MNLSFGAGDSASAYSFARRREAYIAYAKDVTALPAYTAKALGPILWNGAGNVSRNKVILLGVSIAVTTASAAAVAVGVVTGTGQPNAPITTTAATLMSSSYGDGSQPGATFYNAGTVVNAPNTFLPVFTLDTAALTVQTSANMFVPLDGLFVIPPGSYIALAASATATTSVLQVGFVWAEASV